MENKIIVLLIIACGLGYAFSKSGQTSITKLISLFSSSSNTDSTPWGTATQNNPIQSYTPTPNTGVNGNGLRGGMSA